MKRLNLIFLILLFGYHLKAQKFRNTVYLPPEYLVSALENEYHSDTSYHLYYENLRLRDDCKFINEFIYNKNIIARYIGKYYISCDIMYFSYDDSPEPRDPMIVHFPAVPFGLGTPVNYVVMKKGKLYEPSVKKYKREYDSFHERLYYAYKKLKFKPKRKNYYTLRGNLEFEVCKCK